MSRALTDAEREFASVITQGVAAAMKPTEAPKAEKPDLYALLAQAKPGTRVKYDGLDILLPEKDDPADKPTPKAEEAKEEVVELGQQLLSVIEKPLNGIKVPFVGSKLGSVVVGGGIGLLLAEVNRGYQDTFPEPVPGAGISRKQRRIGGNIGGLVLIGLVGKKVMSNEANFAAATVLGVNIIADVLPINEWVTNIVNRIRGVPAQQRLHNRTISPGYVAGQPLPLRHGVGNDAISRGGR